MSDCAFCGDEAEHEHHIIPRRVGGPDTPDNLVEVCAGCHRTLERIYDDEFWDYRKEHTGKSTSTESTRRQEFPPVPSFIPLDDQLSIIGAREEAHKAMAKALEVEASALEDYLANAEEART